MRCARARRLLSILVAVAVPVGVLPSATSADHQRRTSRFHYQYLGKAA
jgi:hypothetical protein